jgi:membrane-bound ClpP family serine protease
MRRVFTFLEILVSGSLLILGLYALKEGISNNSPYAIAFVLVGALLIAASLMTVIFAVRSILWHRTRSRHATGNHRLSRTAKE